jgi:hypothetical protein
VTLETALEVVAAAAAVAFAAIVALYLLGRL